MKSPMNILAFSVNPLYPDLVTGGASVHLRALCLCLGQLGHSVTVLCPRETLSRSSFSWSENVVVHPCLQFNLPFPYPYDLTAYELAFNVRKIREHLTSTELFYIHDCQWLIPQVVNSIPTVVGIHDIMYPETMLGSFTLNADRYITVSDYAYEYYLANVGQLYQDVESRFTVVPYGFDWKVFRRVAPSADLYEALHLSPSDCQNRDFILHPHRPEGTKGLEQSLRTVAKVVHTHQIRNVCLLVPNWLPEMESSADRKYQEEMKILIRELNIAPYVHFHPWIPHRLMPEYYSLGSVTLSLGSFVESFGKSVYESLGCRTPCVYAQVSWHRMTLSELLPGVEYGDLDLAATYVSEYLTGRRSLREHLWLQFQQRYSHEKQLERYAQVLLSATKLGPLTLNTVDTTRQMRFRIAPWCYRSSRGVYHDQRAEYQSSTSLLTLSDYCDQNSSFNVEDGLKLGVSSEEIEEFWRIGYLVPVRKANKPSGLFDI